LLLAHVLATMGSCMSVGGGGVVFLLSILLSMYTR
jgi:hypothetical protein